MFCIGTRSAKDKAATAGVGELHEGLVFVFSQHNVHGVLDVWAGPPVKFVCVGPIFDNFMHGGAGHELGDECVDGGVEGGRKQQALPTCSSFAQHPLHRVKKPKFGHVVGLIDHGHCDLAEVQMATLAEVFDATRGADRNVHATLQGVKLRFEGLPTNELAGKKPNAAGNGLHRAINLQCEFPSWGEYQRLWRLCARARRSGLPLSTRSRCACWLCRERALSFESQQPFNECGPKRDGFATAGSCATEQMVPGECVRNGDGLDGEGLRGAKFSECSQNIAAEAKVAETQPEYLGWAGALRRQGCW